jgi:hypothetical protein
LLSTPGDSIEIYDYFFRLEHFRSWTGTLRAFCVEVPKATGPLTIICGLRFIVNKLRMPKAPVIAG